MDKPKSVLAFWRRLSPAWKLAIWVVVTTRIGTALVNIYSVRLAPPPVVGPSSLVLPVHNLWDEYLSTWQRWDARWYQVISEHGYHANDGTVHFQPLYPLLCKIVSIAVGGQIVLAQLIVSTLALLVAAALMYRLARLDVGPIAASLSVLLLACFPTGFFFLAPYTEGLFLMLVIASFWFARQDRPWLAGLMGAGAALTRIFGIILVLPLAFEYFRQREGEERHFNIGLIGSTLPAVALIGLSIYDRNIVGERASAFQLSARWGQHFEAPWKLLPASIQHIRNTGDPIEVLNVVCLIGFTVLGLFALRKLPLVYGLYVFPYLGLLYSDHLFVSPLASVCRYSLALFPCFIMLATWLARRPWLAAGCLAASGLLQAALLEEWVHWGFIA